LAVHVIDDSGSTVVFDESVESHSGAFVTAARSSRSCCNSTSPTRGIDVSVGTSVDSVDEATVESVDEATVESVDEATVVELDELDELDEATLVEVDEATVEVVEALVDVVVAG
jgi:flavin-binding protein dodecin